MNEIKTLSCPACQTVLELEEDYYAEMAGQTLPCPECGQEVEVPPAEAPRRPAGSGKKRIVLRPRPSAGTPAPPTDTGTAAGEDPAERKTCPGCEADLEENAVLCVSCGMNLQTGVQAAAPPETQPSKPAAARQAGRWLVGAAAIAAIFWSGFRIYARHRDTQIHEQSRIVGQAIHTGRHSTHYTLSVSLLERVLQENKRWATNLTEAAEVLAACRRELEQVPRRTAAVKTAIEAAQQATTLSARIDTLAPVLEQNPGAENRDEANRLLTHWRHELRLREGLQAEMDRARQAARLEDGIKRLQEAIPKFGNAPNLQEAYDLLAELRARLEDAP